MNSHDLFGSRFVTGLDKARALALVVPAALLAGALGSQYLGGLHPCEMCHWQRWGHYAALAFAALAFPLRRLPDLGRSFVWLAALGILSSGFVGAYHAGVEAKVFEGFTQCTTAAGGGGDLLKDILSAPLVRCDEVQFQFLGLSMAGWNALISTASAMVILWLSLRRPRATS
ncbi:MAG: disulfide bond formation protein B [Pseudomonadota bacterium]|jgi:disulfide bond formation protein DsbB|nr:disulfide bond formation protein B [Pseudomonadota bacterium]